MIDLSGRLAAEIALSRRGPCPTCLPAHLGEAPTPRPEKVAAGKRALMAMAWQFQLERGMRA